MKTRIRWMLALSMCIALAVGAMPTSTLAGKPGNDFSRLAADMVRFHALGILQGDYERGVTFNTALAKQYGFPEPAIRLGEQVAAATNELIARAKESQVKGTPAQVTEISLSRLGVILTCSDSGSMQLCKAPKRSSMLISLPKR